MLKKNFTILYVEDDEMVRKSAVEYLERVAKEVLQAKDGKEAIQVWKKNKPDIIITDISMPVLMASIWQATYELTIKMYKSL